MISAHCLQSPGLTEMRLRLKNGGEKVFAAALLSLINHGSRNKLPANMIVVG
jgi:hypothetical protein